MRFFCFLMMLCGSYLHGANDQQHAMIFFYRDLGAQSAAMEQVFDRAVATLGDRVNAKKVRLSDPAEKAFVEKHFIESYPMPLVLVFASNGAIVSGFPAHFNEQQLVQSLSSPLMARCVKACQDHKLVFLCLQNDRTKGNTEARRGVDAFMAEPRIADAAEVILVDPTSQQESKFIALLGVDKGIKEATTIVMMPPGHILATYQGATTKEQIVGDLQKACQGCGCQGGCCCHGCCGH